MAGDTERARRLLGLAADIAPQFDKALNNLGVFLARNGDPERALEAYQRGLAVSPDNPTLLLNLMRLYHQIGRPEEAEKLAARVEQDPGGEIEGNEIICPRHGARFCLRTGEALTPPAYEPVRTFETKIEDGRLWVRAD